MRLPKISFSILALVTANVVPLFGVMFFGWDAAFIVLLYWAENVVIGTYTILKIALVKVGSSAFHLGKLLAIPFFCIHFGGFCAGHGFFLIVFFNLGDGMDSFFPKEAWPGPLVFLQLLVSVIHRLWQNHPEGMEWPVIGLFVSHGVSFVQNYLGKREYVYSTVDQLMKQPYKRIVILHVAIIAGGVPIMMLGSPVPLLCVLVLLKVGLDIYLHMKEHKVETVDEGKPNGPLASERAVPSEPSRSE